MLENIYFLWYNIKQRNLYKGEFMLNRMIFLGFAGFGIVGLFFNSLYRLFFKKKVINEIIAIICLSCILIGLIGIKFFV